MASFDAGQTATADSVPVPEVGAQRTPEHISAFRRVPWQVRDIAIGLAPLVVWRLLESLERQWILSLSVGAYWAFYVLPPLIWMIVFPVWIARRRSSVSIFVMPRMSGLFKEAVISLLAWFAAFVCLVVVLAATAFVFGKDAIPADPWEGLSGSKHPASIVVFLLMAITFGPVSEEIFCRGFLYNALRRRCPTAVAIVLQALFFSLMHPYGIGYALFAFFLGIVLAVIYDWRRTLLAPIFVHCIQNSVACVRGGALMIAAMNVPHLGVNGTAGEGGCLIAVVTSGTTAEEIGLRKGDVIAKFDGQSVHDIADLAKLVRQKTVGDHVEIEVIRDHRTILKEAVLRR